MNAKISAAILAHMAAGKTLPEAYDAVFGAGAYAKFVSEAYAALRETGRSE